MAAESAIFTRSGMLSTSLCFFGGTSALWGEMILRCRLVGFLVSSEYSVTIVLSNLFSLFEIDATATGMVFHFQDTLVQCCSGRVRAPDAATVTMLRRVECWCWCKCWARCLRCPEGLWCSLSCHVLPGVLSDYSCYGDYRVLYR